MSATLNDFLGIIYESMPSFNREMTGFLPSVQRNAEASRASLYDTVRIPLAEVEEPQDVAPAATAPASRGDSSYDKVDIKIEKSESIFINLEGESDLAMQNAGNYERLMKSRFESAFRKLANRMESYIAGKAVAGASRAYGTVGTTPFGTPGNILELAKVAQILDDNGAPRADRNLVLNSAAMANMRGVQTLLLKANEAGTDEFLRTGYTNPVLGFKLWNSAGLVTHEQGAGTGYKLAAEAAKGSRILTLDTGSGVINAGDIVTFGSDANKYVVNTGIEAAGSLEIGKPGLMQAAASATAMTSIADYQPNVAFTKDAIAFAARVPAIPTIGDAATDASLVYDDKSGITFSVRIYPQYHQSKIEIGVAYGAKVIQSDNVALLIG